MTRQEYIENVKVKLDEVSPFDEPLTFIAAEGDTSYSKVKPITAYIDEELDNATRYCLNVLPLSLLAEDITKEEKTDIVISNGVGSIDGYSNKRLCRVSAKGWDRDVTHFFTSADVTYLLQQNNYTRSGKAKPSVYYVPENKGIELYSFPDNYETTDCAVWTINLLTKAEDVKSAISDFISIKCAQLVLDILGSNNAALMEKEFERKVNAL
jgi:hypothetical protein